MDVESFRLYCLGKHGVTEGFPFDESVLVFKIMGKIFALTNLDGPQFEVNLKCDPERAIELRTHHIEIKPGYHMNKKHWNTILFDGDLSEKLLLELTDHSYQLVVQSLKKSDRLQLAAMEKGDSDSP